MSPLCDTKVRPAAYGVGVLLGCAAALLCSALLHFCVSTSAGRSLEKATTPAPILSRRERAAKLLNELRPQQASASSDVSGAVAEAQMEANTNPVDTSSAEAGNECCGEGEAVPSNSSSSSSWASTSTHPDEEEEDSEYERMEDLRLKMVFVVRHPVQPKMSAQEVAVLTASAGVRLVELHHGGQNVSSRSSAETCDSGFVAASASSTFAPTVQDWQRWRHWYLWWNRIGCGKITLKCPEEAVMAEVVRAAEEKRLLVVQLRRSQFGSHDGVAVEKMTPSDSDEVVVVALGPAPSDLLNPVTGALKLYS
ncbi:hypothetical protein ABB37_02968 [Leptomonas pyrrhocoris]|uniref:peptidyl-tRNA hydrolase n=1 Tax=Leptomonas pyrrhocoris TaxID=157538 RepID=A0A0N0DXS0_LEPPY|nr:hypothetical protein ABB37_02968 [Leptomonas pyrrhocoris]KPA83305.1 hypothetical protein ABB37_02968 [Leptomonas pyrrhocoris]|eukprot:XP_015661744.1 hypothetical protein ABB37_02968 [Leptomonas pyrrhocoris]